jgi:hypothetical protein
MVEGGIWRWRGGVVRLGGPGPGLDAARERGIEGRVDVVVVMLIGGVDGEEFGAGRMVPHRA